MSLLTEQNISMLDQSGGKMFLASERGYSETSRFRSYNTFNYRTYQNEYKGPFGPLYVLNDHTLAGGHSTVQFIEEDTEILLIPIVGSINYLDSRNNKTTVYAGQVLIHTLPKGATFELLNPYEAELINYIEIGIKQPLISTPAEPQIIPFDLDHNKNTLLSIVPSQQYIATQRGLHYKVSIAKMEGRKELVYNLAKPGNGLFAFIIEGAFEVQYRLLESRDGLALWSMKEIEIEALSNDAIILLIDVDYLKIYSAKLFQKSINHKFHS